MTRAQHTALSRAFSRFDRLTAFGCAQRREPYDAPACQALWQQYQRLLAEAFPEEWTA